ncbi:MAG: type VI secretion system lipoprotein TssJ [Iodobacter sp.]
MKKKYMLMQAAIITALLSGCGAIQTVTDTVTSVSKAVFIPQIKVLKIDLTARDELNTSQTGDAHTVVVRIYQLKNRETFDGTEIGTLWNKDKEILKQDLVGISESIISPGSQKSLTEKMEPEADYIAIVAFYENVPKDDKWKVVTPRLLMSSTEPLKFELVKNSLRALPENGNGL